MRKLNWLSLAPLGMLLAFMLSAVTAHAQASRTWVSGVGDDVNPCSRTAPCKTFAGAISKTAPGGIINCIDSGGYGAVTITKAITIDCLYVHAGALVAQTNAINVIIAPTDVVTLRGLSIEGVPGLIGVSHTGGGVLHIELCTIKGFTGSSALGVNFAPSSNSELYIEDSFINDNGSASAGGGVLIRPTGSASALAMLSHVRLNNNLVGLVADGGGGSGQVRVQFTDSVASGNINAGIASSTPVSGPITSVFLERSSAVNNANIGVYTDGGNASVILSNTTISFNNYGVVSTNGSHAFTYGSNNISANPISDGTPLPSTLTHY